MAIWVAVTAALGASTCGATVSALQHRTRLQWWAAMAVQGMGFLLHALALRSAQLTVVQPLLVCAVLFALPLTGCFTKNESPPGRSAGRWCS